MKFEIEYLLESNRFLISHNGNRITGPLGCSPDFIAKAIQNFTDVLLNGDDS